MTTSTMAALGWLLAGLLGGWLGCWLFDRLYRRDGAQAGDLAQLHLDSIHGALDRLGLSIAELRQGQAPEPAAPQAPAPMPDAAPEVAAALAAAQQERDAALQERDALLQERDTAQAAAEAAERERVAVRVMLGGRLHGAEASAPAELAQARERIAQLEQQLASAQGQAALAAADAEAARHGFVPQRQGQDDLTLIEGIGPKIAGVLRDGGIRTFAALATAEVAQLAALLEAAGPRFKLANPGTWPQQAALAAKGQWHALHELQAQLSAGLPADGASA